MPGTITRRPGLASPHTPRRVDQLFGTVPNVTSRIELSAPIGGYACASSVRGGSGAL